MTDTRILLLTLLSACLVALAHWLRDDVRPLRIALPAWARTVGVVVLGSVLVPAVDAVVASGAPFWASVLQGAGSAVPALLPLILDALLRVPPAAGLLLLVALGASQTGYAGSLEAARTEGLTARRGMATGTAPSSYCRGLDSERGTLSGVAKTFLVAASTSGVLMLIPEVRDSQPGRIAVIGASAAFGATGYGFQTKADADTDTWTRECSQ